MPPMAARSTTTSRFQTMTAAGSAVRASSVPSRSGIWAREAVAQTRLPLRTMTVEANPGFFIRTETYHQSVAGSRTRSRRPCSSSFPRDTPERGRRAGWETRRRSPSTAGSRRGSRAPGSPDCRPPRTRRSRSSAGLRSTSAGSRRRRRRPTEARGNSPRRRRRRPVRRGSRGP